MSRPFSNDSVFRAVADPSRRKIMQLLRKGDSSVIDLAQSFQFTLATMSHHLGVLRVAGLISQHRKGSRRVYRLERPPLREIAGWLRAIE